MPRQTFVINDFSGGLNSEKSSRAIEDNEVAECVNFDPCSKGKLRASKIFLTDARYGDTGSSTEHVAGVGLIAFSNDYGMDDAAFSGQFLGKQNNGALDILPIPIAASGSNGTWSTSELTSISATSPSFYAAEGDLFAGGDHSTTPTSLVFLDHAQIPGSSISRIQTWAILNQNKPIPTASTDGTAMALFMSSSGGTDDDIADQGVDALAWIIKDKAGSEGLWTQTVSDAENKYEFVGTWLYKNNAESDVLPLAVTGEFDLESRAVHVQASFGDSDSTTAALQDKYGARLYCRYSGDKGDYYLLAEIDLEKGIKGDGETEWSPWYANTAANNYDLAYQTGDIATTGLLPAPPKLLTFKILNGYAAGDIPDTDATAPKDRIVYFKAGLVANSRAYIGNVKINGRSHGDRILKSPIYQYDLFTEDSFLDVAINDGDQITALAAHGDRLLQFKSNSVYVINVSKELEFLEDEMQGAGVTHQASVTTTPFGVVWVNTNGCYHYDGDKIQQLRTGKISDTDWTSVIDAKPAIGYEPKRQQLLILGNTEDPGASFCFDVQSGSWYKISAVLDPTVNATNMVLLRGDDLVIGGGTTAAAVHRLADRAAAVSGYSLKTKIYDLGNPESRKNIKEVAVTYNGNGDASADIKVHTNKGTVTLGQLTDTSTADYTQTLTSSDAKLKGCKTIQIELSGTYAHNFELYTIVISYRDIKDKVND